MYFNKAIFDENEKCIQLEIICNKCGKVLNIDDISKFNIIKSDYCIASNNIDIRCDSCGEKCNTGLIEYKKHVMIKTSTQKNSSMLNIPKCPTCGSTKLSKVSTISKAGSVALWGLFSQKVKKIWHCNNCGYEW